MSKKRKKKQLDTTLKEQLHIEESLGVKFLNFKKGIFVFENIIWKPVGNGIGYLCAVWDKAPILTISVGGSTCHFIPLTWKL